MQKVFPGYYAIMAKPTVPGITKDTMVMGKDITLVTAESLPDDVAYAITKALWDHYKELGPIHPTLKLWTNNRFASLRAVVPYHAGSIRLYKEKGVWSKELEEHQNMLMKLK